MTSGCVLKRSRKYFLMPPCIHGAALVDSRAVARPECNNEGCRAPGSTHRPRTGETLNHSADRVHQAAKAGHDRTLRAVRELAGHDPGSDNPGALRIAVVAGGYFRAQLALGCRRGGAAADSVQLTDLLADARVWPSQPVSQRLGESLDRFSARRAFRDAAVCMGAAPQLSPRA